MSPEILGHKPENQIPAWLERIDQSRLRGAVSELWTQGTMEPSYMYFEEDYRIRAQRIYSNPELSQLYQLVYPEADTDRLDVVRIDLRTIAEHHNLLQSMDLQSTSSDRNSRILNHSLLGSTPEDLVRYHRLRDVISEPSPAVLKRIHEGMSSELKVLTARVRLDYYDAHLRESLPGQHDVAWWRQAVIDTLQLTPEDMLLVKELGVRIDAAAA